MSPLYEPDPRRPDVFHATPLTRGPWDNRFQHGGPPSALLSGAMARFGHNAAGFTLAHVRAELLRPVPLAPAPRVVGPAHMGKKWHRPPADPSAVRGAAAGRAAGAVAGCGDKAAGYTCANVGVGLLRPVPMAPGRVVVSPEKMGRTAQRLSANLFSVPEDESSAPVHLATARAVRIRRTAPLSLPSTSAPRHRAPWPAPEQCPPLVLGFFKHDVSYMHAVELRLVYGEWPSTPIGVWARTRVPLRSDQSTSAMERLMIIADAQSGMGPPLNPMSFSYVNPDLTVYVERSLPEAGAGWMGFEIRSTADPSGFGLSQSEIRDVSNHIVARSAQSMVIVPLK